MRIVATTAIAALILGTGSDATAQERKSFHNAVAPAPAAGTIFLYPERIPLQDGGFFNAERGIYFAPVNRSRSGSDVIGVEVYRFRASPQARPGTPPVFFLHGGPSFGGLESSLENEGTFESRWLPMTHVSDVVVVGQRGIGSSKPTTTIETTTRSPVPGEQWSDGRQVADLQRVLSRERSFWEGAGLDLSGYTVLEAAEDVNEVRQALGYEKIIIWGGSFGSHWGMSLMRMHPDIVERASLRGMEGPDHTYDDPGHLWNVYRRIAEEAEAYPPLRDRIPDGGLVAAWESIVQRATEAPFTVTVTDPEDGSRHDVVVDGESIKLFSRGVSGGLSGWPAGVIEAAEGDFSDVALSLYGRSLGGGSGRRSFRTASYYQLDCGSGITPQRLARQTADPANTVLFRMNYGYIAGCPAWDSDLGNDFRQNFETEIPTVIVHGTWDTSTPYENALELVPYFKDSKFIPVIRGPHGSIQAAMRASREFDAGIYHFAATGDWTQLPDTVWMPPVEYRVPGRR